MDFTLKGKPTALAVGVCQGKLFDEFGENPIN